MFSTGKRLAALEQRLATLERALYALDAKVNSSTAEQVRASVSALADDLAQLRERNRSEFGKLWYRLRGETPAAGRVDAPFVPEQPTEVEPEFDDLIAAQRAWSNGGSH